MHKLVSSGLKWLFRIIANPARLMNNLGCDWALPDGWNEMPPLAFQQLGEVVIPTGWWELFWITDGHEEPTKYPWVMYSFCGGTRFLPPNSLFLFLVSTDVAVRLNQRDCDPYPYSLPGTHPNRLLGQDGARGLSGAARSRGGLWDVEPAVA